MSLDEKMKETKKCIEIAEKAISVENFEKAKRMLLKAERIGPSDTAQQLLKRIERLNINNNEDESDVMAAEMCITIARIAIENNNTEKAETFLLKSINLHPMDESKELLKRLKDEHECKEQLKLTGKLEIAEESTEIAQNAFHKSNCSSNFMEQMEEKLSENHCLALSLPQPKREVSSEQISEIARVKQANDDYDILGIPRGSGSNEVKKAYKDLTKVLHPDKNRAPGAKDAFMMAKEATDRLKSKLNKKSDHYIDLL